MTSPLPTAYVDVPVAGVWADPSSPREVDALILTDSPDHAGWLAAMDAMPSLDEGRLGLLDRYETEVLRDEPVLVRESTPDGWSLVVCPWQPSMKDPQGYPGYVRTAHLREGDPGAYPSGPEPAAAATVEALLAQARRHVGLTYLWGGISPAGLDCSGLVYFAARTLGLTVPRDAGDQYDACLDIPLGDVRPGDLYFFADEGKPIHHVGIVTAQGHMVHAPSTGHGLTEEPLPAQRRATLTCAGRLPALR